MKLRVIIPFILFLAAAILATHFFSGYLADSVGLIEVKANGGINAVNFNDVVKKAGIFLEDGDALMLTNSLERYGFDLSLYGADGEILFDSANQSNTGMRADINYVLSTANENKRVFTVNAGVGKRFAIAVIDTHDDVSGLDRLKRNSGFFAWGMCAGFVALSSFMFLFFYVSIMRPFKKLEFFTGEVAKGNLDVPLAQSRRNIFGAFTWAFDMLRNELKASKEKETEAQRSKKELVAVLSHDIRTPVASIKACTEYLKGMPDKNGERGLHYIDRILEKTDEITRLSGDLFLHAISDLERLEVSPGTFQSRELINKIIEPLILQFKNNIAILAPIPDVPVHTDPFRLTQVMENILSNADKYAPGSKVEITSAVDGNMLKFYFRDYGNGILPEDAPFIFDKFYRGRNAKESKQAGSGLGLYISRYILERTGGAINASNCSSDGSKGFLVEVSLKIAG